MGLVGVKLGPGPMSLLAPISWLIDGALSTAAWAVATHQGRGRGDVAISPSVSNPAAQKSGVTPVHVPLDKSLGPTEVERVRQVHCTQSLEGENQK